ncbi:hypothetical protein VTG60DRAFT_3694 [Thermothelomyces hinnuleus]
MSNEYLQHLQCQTCFVSFATNRELVGHIEEYRYRERLLVAELERCRLHIARLDELTGGNDSDNDGDGEDDDEDDDDDDDDDQAQNNGDGPTAQLHCAYPGCRRKSPFTTRSNLIRHFQTHIQCYEPCPFCHEVITQAYKFINHNCKAKPDERKTIYMRRRRTQLAGVVSKEMDRLARLRNKRRKRGREARNPDSFRPPKISKKDHDWSGEANSKMAFPPDSMRIAATNNTEWDFTKTPVIMPAGSAELVTQVEITTGGAADHGTRAFAGTSIAANNGGWAFAETAGAMSAGSLGINTDMLGDHGFAEAALSSNNDGWAFAETAMHINDGGWAFAEGPP